MTQHALIFAATGAISQGVARALAALGTSLSLAGRDARVDAIADDLRDEYGVPVWSDHVDALDEQAVADFVNAAALRQKIDVVFNGIGGPPAELRYPKLTVESSLDDFLLPIRRIVGSQFITSREGARVMADNGGGAVVTLSATLSGMTTKNMAGITSACGAIEAMTRALAGDFGARGVRVNCVRGSAMPETRTIQHTFAGQTAILGEPMSMAPPPLGRPILVSETAATAAWLASQAASGITGQVVTVCAGQFVGQG